LNKHEEEEIKNTMNFRIRVFAPDVEEQPGPIIEGSNYKTVLDSVTQAMVERALIATKGNKIKAAALININRNTLHKYFKKLPYATRTKFDKDRVFVETEGAGA